MQVDTNGNIYIADAGNNVVRAIYMGKGNLPGITAPITGNIYTVAGCTTSFSCTAVGYPKNGTAPTGIATLTAISDRKISLDIRNNLYINDASANVVWFVDNATGDIRVLAGSYGTPTVGVPFCTTGSNTVGDGCPAPSAAFNAASSNAGFGGMSDNQGNYYLTDPEGNVPIATSVSRIRKVLSGLNFPTLTVGAAPVSQLIYVHFAAGDTPAGAFTSNSADYTVAAAPTCTLETDTTTDCLVSVAFSPSRSAMIPPSSPSSPLSVQPPPSSSPAPASQPRSPSIPATSRCSTPAPTTPRASCSMAQAMPTSPIPEPTVSA